jgi:hypothetical protein
MCYLSVVSAFREAKQRPPVMNMCYLSVVSACREARQRPPVMNLPGTETPSSYLYTN